MIKRILNWFKTKKNNIKETRVKNEKSDRSLEATIANFEAYWKGEPEPYDMMEIHRETGCIWFIQEDTEALTKKYGPCKGKSTFESLSDLKNNI